VARLRRALFFLVAIGFIATGLVGCGGYGDDIDAVQTASSVVPGKSNLDLVTAIAGARGTIDWSGGPAPKYQSDQIVSVTADIKRIGGTGVRHEIVLSFIHNRQTKKVAFDGLTVDGRPQDLISGALNMFLLNLE